MRSKSHEQSSRLMHFCPSFSQNLCDVKAEKIVDRAISFLIVRSPCSRCTFVEREKEKEQSLRFTIANTFSIDSRMNFEHRLSYTFASNEHRFDHATKSLWQSLKVEREKLLSAWISEVKVVRLAGVIEFPFFYIYCPGLLTS